MKKLINARGSLLDLSTPAVMGIVNVTPDSFVPGSRVRTEDEVLTRVERFKAEGAKLIDIGAQSTRPGAASISAEEEWKRLYPILPLLTRTFPELFFSIDTFYASVAEQAADAGVHLINDISAGTIDPLMIGTAGRLKMPYILMHMQGTPASMQQQPTYTDVVKEVFDFFLERKIKLMEAGVMDILLDPGFGFGKTIEHNFALLKALPLFFQLDCPLLVGLSRKSMINKVLGTTPEEALNGTTVLNTIALTGGASILRVHDVKEAIETVKLYNAFQHA
jgi:dihydropteroate synthase